MPSEQSTKRIVISYAHEDEGVLEELDPYFKTIDGVNVWWDDYLNPGVFTQQIETQFEKADLAILILSQHFLSSHYIGAHELPIIKRRASTNLIVLPVYWSPCSYLDDEWLSQLLVFTAPRDKPLSALRLAARQEELKRLRKEIVNQLNGPAVDSAKSAPAFDIKSGARLAPIFLRRRMRYVPNASEGFNEFVTRITADNRPADHEELLRAKRDFSDFEQMIADAILLENDGRNLEMRQLLERRRFNNPDQEACRRLYEGIACEKLFDERSSPPDAMLPAMVAYSAPLRALACHPMILLCAQFNVNICLEKLGLRDEVGFDAFLETSPLPMSIQGGHPGLCPYPDELRHKALIMQLIWCMRFGRPFAYGSEIGKVLNEQRRQDPPGFAKTLIMWCQYSRTAPLASDLAILIELQGRLPVNARSAVLTGLMNLAASRDELEQLYGTLESVAEPSRDSTVQRFLDKAKEIMKTRKLSE